jgi:negative regulator of genetic competence, sporulation and motility
MKAHTTNLAAAREIAAKRIADRAREESERKAKEEEKEEQRRKNQELVSFAVCLVFALFFNVPSLAPNVQILEKAQKLLQKSKKREYAMDKLNAKRRKKRNGMSNAMTKLVAPDESIDLLDRYVHSADVVCDSF